MSFVSLGKPQFMANIKVADKYISIIPDKHSCKPGKAQLKVKVEGEKHTIPASTPKSAIVMVV